MSPDLCIRFGAFYFMHRTYKTAILILLGLLSLGRSAAAGTYTDALGRKIALERPPQRIVSLAPNLTEILFFLGLGDRVAGVTKFSTYPEEAKSKPKVGSYVDLNVEKIISLSPDLVIGTIDGNNEFLVDLLDKAGIRVFLVNPRNVDQAIETIATVGEVCGVAEEAEKLASGLQRRVDLIREKTRSLPKAKVFLEINTRPIMTVNRNTFHNDLIALSGGVNIFQDEAITYPRINIEEVLSRNPDVVIISCMERDGKFEAAKEQWMTWKSLRAVKNGRVHLINSDIIDRPSPRIVEGLEKIAKFIHPEIKWD